MSRPENLPETDDLKIRYMASPHVEWTKFAQSEGIDTKWQWYYPVALWRDEKRKKIADAALEAVRESLFDRRHRWHADILKTLTEYPESCEIVHQILRARMGKFAKMINEKDPAFDKVDTHELRVLAVAMKAITDAKYKSLLLDQWNVKVAENDTQPEIKDVTPTGGISFKVIGKGEVAVQDIEKMMRDWLDKPGEGK